MRHFIASALLIAAAMPAGTAAAHAASLPYAAARPADVLIDVQARQQRQGRDCTPYNGPFGFYGNIWCQPPSESSYLRNLSSPWPMDTPPSLRKKKPANGGTDW
jgi:hypothetical protein